MFHTFLGKLAASALLPENMQQQKLRSLGENGRRIKLRSRNMTVEAEHLFFRKGSTFCLEQSMSGDHLQTPAEISRAKLLVL